MVGGAPVDAEFAKRIGADGYGSNAPAGVDLAKKFVGAALYDGDRFVARPPC